MNAKTALWSPNLWSVTADEGSCSSKCRSERIGRIVALILLSGIVGAAFSACASSARHSVNSTSMSAISSCPGQEGYPDCRPN